MNYHDIKKDDLTNGEGIRVTLFVSGCDHYCFNCQNKQTWDKSSGVVFNEKAKEEIFIELIKDYVSGVTLSGGDPLFSANFPEIVILCEEIKECFPTKTIWLYTDKTYEEFTPEEKEFAEKYLDVIVDGEYKEDLRNINLMWRGSSNQRVIDVQKTMKSGEIVLRCND